MPTFVLLSDATSRHSHLRRHGTLGDVNPNPNPNPELHMSCESERNFVPLPNLPKDKYQVDTADSIHKTNLPPPAPLKGVLYLLDAELLVGVGAKIADELRQVVQAQAEDALEVKVGRFRVEVLAELLHGTYMHAVGSFRI